MLDGIRRLCCWASWLRWSWSSERQVAVSEVFVDHSPGLGPGKPALTLFFASIQSNLRNPSFGLEGTNPSLDSDGSPHVLADRFSGTNALTGETTLILMNWLDSMLVDPAVCVIGSA